VRKNRRQPPIVAAGVTAGIQERRRTRAFPDRAQEPGQTGIALRQKAVVAEEEEPCPADQLQFFQHVLHPEAFQGSSRVQKRSFSVRSDRDECRGSLLTGCRPALPGGEAGRAGPAGR
jgi:hypothetical protein